MVVVINLNTLFALTLRQYHDLIHLYVLILTIILILHKIIQ